MRLVWSVAICSPSSSVSLPVDRGCNIRCISCTVAAKVDHIIILPSGRLQNVDGHREPGVTAGLLPTYTIYTQVRLNGLSFEREKRDADQAYENVCERKVKLEIEKAKYLLFKYMRGWLRRSRYV